MNPIFKNSLFCCLTLSSLFGQNLLKDSISKTITLNEVCVYDLNENKDASFDFYKNNKTATIEDILARMSGVNLIKRGAYGLEPTLRSYGTGQTNLTIDGMRIYSACTDKMDPASIYVEPNNLSSIQISHGSSGALNGSTIGGQINMQLKAPNFSCNSKLNGQLSQTYLTNNNSFNTLASIQQSYKKIAYRINGTYRKANDYYAGNNLKIPYSGFEKINIGGTVLMKLNDKQIIKTSYLGDWGKNIGYPALPMDVGYANAQIFSLSHNYKTKNKWVNENEFKIYYNEISHQMDDTHRSNVPMHMDMPGWTKTKGFYNELLMFNKLKFRVDFHNVYSRADMVMFPVAQPIMYMQTLPENNLYNTGASINYNLNFNHNQSLSLSGRIDYFNQYATKGIGYKQWKVFNENISNELINILKNGSIVYSKTIKKHFLTKLSVSYGERLPTNNERYGYYLFNRQDQYDYIGNIHLKPEQSIQSELAFKYDINSISFSCNLFYHYISNYIYSYKLDGLSQMTIGAYGLKTYKNIDFATTKGFEFQFNANFLQNFTYLNSVKYVYAETNTKLPLPLVPPLKAQQALRYKIKLWSFQFEHDYALNQNRINIDYGDKITPSFNLFNFRVSKNITYKSVILQLSSACENIFDLQYREHLDIGQIPRMGRNFSLNANLIF
ncbi:MAG: TonB-dependent receptor [Bacteroidetes bacterium]|nr:TonB-dependent receptor [Bacteroidota bacterium]